MDKIVFELNENMRVDAFLAKMFPDYSRNYFKQLIESKNVLVNSKEVSAHFVLKCGDSIEIKKIVRKEDAFAKPEPQDIKLDIIYEDDNIIVLNKPTGIVIHPAVGNLNGTLVNALLNYYPKIEEAVFDETSSLSSSRPGIVHRLDKDTSGIMIIAKNKKSLLYYSKQFKNHQVNKRYVSLCFGFPKSNRGELLNFLGRSAKNRKVIGDIGQDMGREAISRYKVIKHLVDKLGDNYSLIEFDIKTGRTHQIRVQAKLMGTPVIGDMIYGTKESKQLSKHLGISRQLLHAKEITIPVINSKNRMTFSTPLSSDFETVLRSLKTI